MNDIIGIETETLDELENLIKEDFLGSLKYNGMDEQFEGRQGKLFIVYNVSHVYEDVENGIEESFYVDSIREEIRD